MKPFHVVMATMVVGAVVAFLVLFVLITLNDGDECVPSGEVTCLEMR